MLCSIPLISLPLSLHHPSQNSELTTAGKLSKNITQGIRPNYLKTDILKFDFLVQSKLTFWKFYQFFFCKKSLKSKQKVVKTCKIHVNWSEWMTFLVWVYTSQNVAQTQQNFVQAHACMTAILRISVFKKVLPISSSKDFLKHHPTLLTKLPITILFSPSL